MQLWPDLPQDEQGHDAGEQGRPGQVQPNAVEAQRPQHPQQNNGEHQGGGHGNHRGGQGLLNGQHIALGGERKPADKVGQAKQPQSAHGHGQH